MIAKMVYDEETDTYYLNEFHKESQKRLGEFLRKQKHLSPQEVREMLRKHKALTRGIDDNTNRQISTENNNKTD